MAPSAITPPQQVQQTAELSASAVAQKIAQTAPELLSNANGVETPLRSLDASKLIFTKTKTPMAVPQPGDPIIATSSQCTDHMITAKWTSATGWDAPELKPYGNLSLAPTASVLHYATECKCDFLPRYCPFLPIQACLVCSDLGYSGRNSTNSEIFLNRLRGNEVLQGF